MPSSTPATLEKMVTEILSLNPTSVLDIGIGFGKWGFLCREYLETWKGRNYPNEWKVRVDGMEIWQDYVDGFTWLKTIYNNIYVGDASVLILRKDLPDYDLIIAGDVLEHMPKSDALIVLNRAKEMASKAVIVSVPLGEEWLNNKVFNNPYEKHQASWSMEDLRGFEILKDWKVCNKKGVLAIWRS